MCESYACASPGKCYGPFSPWAALSSRLRVKQEERANKWRGCFCCSVSTRLSPLEEIQKQGLAWSPNKGHVPREAMGKGGGWRSVSRALAQPGMETNCGGECGWRVDVCAPFSHCFMRSSQKYSKRDSTCGGIDSQRSEISQLKFWLRFYCILFVFV